MGLTSGAETCRTWRDAARRWHSRDGTRSKLVLSHEAWFLALLDEEFGPLPLSAIDTDTLDEVVRRREAAGLGLRSRCRLLEVARAVLRSAHRWRWIDSVPHVDMPRRGPSRVRWLRWHEAQRLLQHLPSHLRAAAAFTLETGLRKANVIGLTWANVDLQARAAWVEAHQAKSRRSIPVPLTPTAVAILKAQVGKHPVYCFTFRGRNVAETNTRAWRDSLRRSGIDNFRWHDLRHTWASWHVQKGTPLNVLQELGGWETPSMVRVYAHFAIHHLREHVDRVHDALREDDVRPGVF